MSDVSYIAMDDRSDEPHDHQINDPSNIPIGSPSRGPISLNNQSNNHLNNQSVIQSAQLMFAQWLGWKHKSLCYQCCFMGYFLVTITLSICVAYVSLTARAVGQSMLSDQLSIWLFVASILVLTLTSLLFTIFICLIHISNRSNSQANNQSRLPPMMLPILTGFCMTLIIGLFVWFVIGNVWFLHSDPSISQTINQRNNQTVDLTQRTVFFVLVAVYALFMVHCLIGLIDYLVQKIRRFDSSYNQSNDRSFDQSINQVEMENEPPAVVL